MCEKCAREPASGSVRQASVTVALPDFREFNSKHDYNRQTYNSIKFGLHIKLWKEMEHWTEIRLATLLGEKHSLSSWRDIKTPTSTPPPPNRVKGQVSKDIKPPAQPSAMHASPSLSPTSVTSLSVYNGLSSTTRENQGDTQSMQSEIRELKEALTHTSEELDRCHEVAQRREAERWEAVETMTEMAANFLLVDKERRGLRAELEEARAMAEAARGQEQAQRTLLLAAAAASSSQDRETDADGPLSPSSFAACCQDLEALTREVEQVRGSKLLTSILPALHGLPLHFSSSAEAEE